MSKAEIIDFDTIDNPVDDQISACLNLANPKSFFLFAGAGSGKTRSLVEALKYIQGQYSRSLKLMGQKVGVITYTNAACDEINSRIEFDPLFHVSTIHSFAWSLIQGFNKDIRKWLEINLKNEIAELEEKQAKGRAGKASIDRARKIESKTKRLALLKEIKKFTYNPNGDNLERDSLNHSEVIQMCSDFLLHKPTMQNLLITRFPLLLVDESQDTNKHLMDALFEVQTQHSDRFALGLLGDMMQRIYSDGKEGLGDGLPADWETPSKKMNHRSGKRIVTLINKIRASVDGQEQTPRNDRGEGLVRLFILPSNTENKPEAELIVTESMANATNDPGWFGANQDVKTLILEHHMAAKRMGFEEMFEPLYKIDKFRTGLLDGTMTELRLFSNLVLPLIEALEKNDKYAVASIIRKKSPLLSKNTLKAINDDQTAQLKKVRAAVNDLFELWANNGNPNFLDVLLLVKENNLFEIPERFIPIISRNFEEQAEAKVELESSEIEKEDDRDSILDALDKFLLTPFSQIKPYVDYINQIAPFDTHQGVKGREFPRVMVIIDDSEARGFLFSYEKLFGVKEKSSRDIENEEQGKETSHDRTRRLFYVTCSRAEDSLAIIAYSDNPQKVYTHALNEGWFEKDEIQVGLK